ncbi:MAG: hypothetical protein Ct9H300mP27_07940 [Chloroflexota bacterium]|nr:MAG: hypothetical protein Ct9H300mP27_07940 [Chloroflexota bacterium]
MEEVLDILADISADVANADFIEILDLSPSGKRVIRQGLVCHPG